MDMTQKWFLKLNIRRQKIATNFDWIFFLKGIEMLINLDHSTSTAKVLWLLYQILHTFPTKQRDHLLEIILDQETFFKLFFHWSGNVRRSFYYFFYFQLHRIFIDTEIAANDMT